MVAIINTGKAIRRAFQYNEDKLKEGKATLLTAENIPFALDQSTAFLRLKMLEKVTSLREDVAVNCVHISLNFSPGERLSDTKMAEIAKDYIAKIGFEEQPFYVYRHYDSGHDHCHIVTTNVRLDGNRISLHHLGRLKSEPARIELEIKYGLIRAEDHKKDFLSVNPVDATKVLYGKTDTKRAIANVLAQVLEQFKFTTITELNAVLNLYNVHAESGQEGSRLQQFNGLQYGILDGGGNPVGTPIKASLFHNKPTKKYLEKLFVKNHVERQQYKQRIQTTISFLLKSKAPKSLSELKTLLQRDNIRLLPRLNKAGIIYGVTYVDLKTKTVFNGNALGKQFSAKGLLSTIHLKDSSLNSNTVLPQKKGSIGGIVDKSNGGNDRSTAPLNNQIQVEKSLLELLTQYEFVASSVPYEWRKKDKMKKKRK